MSRGPYPIMLMLAMALPGTVRALGLGEIRVDSALNEPLSAQIEIVGATRDELMALTAKVAAREIFQRYGAERPSFLATATFKVGLDSQGHPVLNVRSGEAFTDPLVHFLVDLRWGQNDLIRDYSLLLDPAGFNSPRRAAEAVQAAVAQALPAAPTAIEPVSAAAGAGAATTAEAVAGTRSSARASSSARSSSSVQTISNAQTTPTAQTTPSASPLQHRITARDTLRGIARRSGARSESHVQRMMIAIFRANPGAFDGNINRLHRGAVITLPNPAQLAAISATDAKREVRAQMTAWRLDGRPSTAPREASRGTTPMPAPALAAGASSSATSEPAAADAVFPGTATTDAGHPPASLQQRVEFLEQALQDMHRQLAVHNAKLRDLDATPATARTAAPAPLTSGGQTESPPDVGVAPIAAATGPLNGKAFLGPIAAGVTLLLAGFAYVRGRRRRSLETAAGTIEATPVAESALASSVAAPQPARASDAAHEPNAANETPNADAALKTDAGLAADASFTADAGFTADVGLAADAALASAAAPQRKSVLIPKPVAPAAPRASETAPRVATKSKGRTNGNQTTVVVEVDTEALERSYLDSLGIDTTTLDDTLETTADTARLDAVGVSKDAAATTAESHARPAGGTTTADTTDVDTSSTAPLHTIDLEATVEHVQMPSGLNDRPVVSERRANIIDALKMAIDRDPHRGDLRMKLLETYFTATLNSRSAFMDGVRKMARERDQVSPEDWRKVVEMGREIAADDLLFSDSPLDRPPGRLADCA